jgi:hypothetical protein
MTGTLTRKLFGSSNERRIKRDLPRVAEINALESELEPLSDEEERRNGVDVVGGGCLLRLSGGVTSITARCGTMGRVATAQCSHVRSIN